MPLPHHDKPSTQTNLFLGSLMALPPQTHTPQTHSHSAAPAISSPPYLNASFCHTQNARFRPTMEDASKIISNFQGVPGNGYFAVFDGHAGSMAAKWCAAHLYKLLARNLALFASQASSSSMAEVLALTFDQADARLCALPEYDDSGCTAALIYIKTEYTSGTAPPSQHKMSNMPPPTPSSFLAATAAPRRRRYSSFSPASPQFLVSSPPNKDLPTVSTTPKRTLYTANVGDSRIVLCRNGVARRLTADHKATDASECLRIKANGGVVSNGRVDGSLSVTRALGDKPFKPYVSPRPYTTQLVLDEQDEFLVLACDGVWDVCTDQAIVDLVRDIEDPIEASQEVVRHALFQGSTDNITCMVVRLRDPTIGSSDFYEERTMTSTTTLPITIPHNPATSTTPTSSPRRLQRKTATTTKKPDEPFTVTIVDTADLPADAIPLAKRKALDIKPRRAPPLDTATVTVASEDRLRPPPTPSSSFNGLLLNSPISPAESDLTISEEDETEACVIGGVGVDLDDADADVDDDDEDDDELLYEGIMGAVELSKSTSFDRATSSTGSTRNSRILRPPPTDFLHMRATSFSPSSVNSLNGDLGGFSSGSRPRSGMFRKAAEDNLLALELEHNTESSSLDRYGRFKRIVRLEYDADDADECAIADSD